MNCNLSYTGRRDGRGRYIYTCRDCGRVWKSRYKDKQKLHVECTSPSPSNAKLVVPYGPGWELAVLFGSLGLEEKSGCQCHAVAAAMNNDGVDGCRSRRGEYVAKLTESAKLYNWREKLAAGAAAWRSSIPLSVAGMFDEALRRAAAKDAWQPVRNCIYHVAALKANDLWLRNLEQIKKRWSVFNGRRIIAYAVGDACHTLREVRQHLPDATIIEVPNDPQLREVASFVRLLQEVESRSADTITFYGHTKGNSTAESVKGSVRWRNSMYKYLLDDVEQVRRALCTHTFCGTHKITWLPGHSPYPSGLAIGTWMHAGTFFWFRHDEVFTKPRWWEISNDRYAAEAWPSTICEAERAWSMYQPWPDREHRPNPYDPKWYPEEFDDNA